MKKIEDIFNQAVELPFNERPPFLQGICGNDKELFLEVDSLLQPIFMLLVWCYLKKGMLIKVNYF
ncbi:hypothetical protein L0244_06115 [bacterium]|nr:hypothetical protein [bacterium]